MRFVSSVLAACVAASLSGAASASVVAEVEGNDSLATAQNLDGYFTVGSDPNVTNAATTPYVSVISGPGGSNYDYYSFTVATAGSYGIFDIDFGMNDFDPWLTVFDAAGNLLTTQDDLGYTDPGSVHRYDPYLDYTFATAGQYFVRVGSYPSNSAATGDYQLNVSLQSPAVPAVPEPSTWGMMLLGFGAAGYALRRRPVHKLARA